MRRPEDEGLPPVRASDAERDQTVLVLREHCAQGRLTLEEFSERIELVLNARTRVELDTVTRDLPVARLEPEPLRRERVRARTRKRFVAIMGRSARTKRWRVPEQADALAIMGECEIDLREAIFTGERIEFNAVAVMGEIRIVVPEGMDVDMSGFSFMGENECRPSREGELPGMPDLHVRAFSLMGRVEVVARPRAGGVQRSIGPAR